MGADFDGSIGESPKSIQTKVTNKGKRFVVYEYGELDYLTIQSVMQEFALRRDGAADDRILLLQHPQLYTQGTACHQGPLIPSKIPTLKSDRGGQITFHGPGQIVLYPLLKLKEHGIGVKELVRRLEESVLKLLDEYQISGTRREGAPGVYVNDKKIAALGLRIRNGTSYHGLSLNVDMDLAPFSNIDPCGYQGLEVTQLADIVQITKEDLPEVSKKLVNYFCEHF